MRQIGVARDVELWVYRLDHAALNTFGHRTTPRCSSQRDAFDLDLVAANEPGAADGPRRRIDREELAIDRVHVLVFQHRIDQRIDLDHLGERGAGGFEQFARVGQDLPCFGSHRAARPRAGRRVGRRHTGQKDELARPYRRRKRQAGPPPSAEFDHLSGIYHRRRLTRLRRGDDVEHDLKAGLDPHAHHGAGRRRIRDILSIEAVEHVVLDAVVDHRVYLYDAVQGRADRLKEQFQILEDAARLARHRTVLALAALWVDRHHAGAEDHPAGPDRRALVMAIFPAKIE